jgi:hypothetical protein
MRAPAVPGAAMSPELRTRWTELLELELLSQSNVSALKLPPGLQRRDSLILIGPVGE